MSVVADRALTSRSTLQRIKKGDANVGGGQSLARAELPKRSRTRRTSATVTND
jgi:hypothetical protein